MVTFFISPPFGNYLDFNNITSIKGSFTLYPRGGLITRTLLTLHYNFLKEGWINKIGLRNRGIDYAIEKYKNKKCVVSVAILKQDEIPKLLEKIPSNMNLELNVSCPNITKNDIKEEILINESLAPFLNDNREWCIIKVSPIVDMKLIDSYYRQGFRQFHCSNTFPLEDGRGGLSGKCLINFNKTLIPKIKNKYPDVTIIAGGGITTKEDIFTYIKLGAVSFSFSTVCFNPFKTFILIREINKIKKAINYLTDK